MKLLWLLLAGILIGKSSSQEGPSSFENEVSLEQVEGTPDNSAASLEISRNSNETADVVESLVEKLNAMSSQEDLTSRERIAAFRKITENHNRAKLKAQPSKVNEVMEKFQLLDSVDKMEPEKRIALVKKLAENHNRAQLDLQPSRALTIMEKFHMVQGTSDMDDRQKIAILKKLALDQNTAEQRKREEIEAESRKPKRKPSLKRFNRPVFADDDPIIRRRAKQRRFPQSGIDSQRQDASKSFRAASAASRFRAPGGKEIAKPDMSMIVITTPKPTPDLQPKVPPPVDRTTFNFPSQFPNQLPGQSDFPPVFGLTQQSAQRQMARRATLKPRPRPERPVLNALANLRGILAQGKRMSKAEQQNGFELPPGLSGRKDTRSTNPFSAQPQNVAGSPRALPQGFPNLPQFQQGQFVNQRGPPFQRNFFPAQSNARSQSFLDVIPSNNNLAIPSARNGPPSPFSVSPSLTINPGAEIAPPVIPNFAALGGHQPSNQGQSRQSIANSQPLGLSRESPFSISPSVGNLRGQLSQAAQIPQNLAAFNQDLTAAQSFENFHGQQGFVARRPQGIAGSRMGSAQSAGVPFGQSTGIGQPQNPNQIMPHLLPAVQELLQSGLNQATARTGQQLPMEQQLLAQSLAAMQKLAKPPQRVLSNISNAAREAVKSIFRANKAAQSSKTPVGTWLKSVFGSVNLPGITPQQKVPQDFRQ